jgi:hypothetical protein
MKSDNRLYEEMADDYVLFMARMESRHCNFTLREHASMLQKCAMVAFTAGYLSDCIWYTEREYEFRCRAFGISDPSSRATFKALLAYRNYANREQLGSYAHFPANFAA